MRERHELAKGVICEKCGTIVTKEENYRKVSILLPRSDITTGGYTTIGRMNLCSDCYHIYEKSVNAWLNSKKPKS